MKFTILDTFFGVDIMVVSSEKLNNILFI